MGGKFRFWRPLVLALFMILFGITLGQNHHQLNIGGIDWEPVYPTSVNPLDLDGLIPNGELGQLRGSLDDSAQGDRAGSSGDSLVKVDVATKNTVVEKIVDSNKESIPADMDKIVIADQGLLESAGQVDGTVVNSEPVPEDFLPEEKKPKPKEPKIHIHTVQSGETLWDISKAYGVSIDTILAANDIANGNRIRVGQKLQILSVDGVLHPVAVGESLWEIANRYGVSMDEIVRANEIADPSRIQPNTKLVIPGASRVLKKDVLVINGKLQKAFEWPVKGRISSQFGPRWGRMHSGLDIAVVTGTPIRAAADGTVSFAGWNGGYGILVKINHGDNVETRYAHLSRTAVKVGQKVTRGQIIAYSGNTGNSTGPHLHFEIRLKGTAYNPMDYLK